MNWILYGAYGYTGKLIAEEATRRELRPILAGRDEAKLRPLAQDLKLDARTFNLDDQAAIVEQLAGCDAVLNCAGPFSQTARPMMEACIAAGVHYLDITGEIEVIEAAAALSDRAAAAGITLMPAVGFDVVPTDCLAAMLAAKMPDATQLRLALCALADVSPGTAKAMAEMMPAGGCVRVDGEITRVPIAWKTRDIKFADRRRQSVTMPWGDVASAYYSTGIGNIEVYMALPKYQIKWLKRLRGVIPLLGFSPFQWVWKSLITRSQSGPSAKQLNEQRVELWGEVSREDGTSIEAVMTTPNGYALTVETALEAVQRLTWSKSPDLPEVKVDSDSGKSGDPSHVGFQTPSLAFGPDFIMQFDNVTMQFPGDE